MPGSLLITCVSFRPTGYHHIGIAIGKPSALIADVLETPKKVHVCTPVLAFPSELIASTRQ